MASDVEIDRVLHTVSATLNDQKLESFDRRRVQAIVTEALGGEQHFTVDDGGGLHEADSGARVGAIRRTDSGEWIVERQNPTAEHSDTAIPTPTPMSKVRQLLTKLRVKGP